MSTRNELILRKGIVKTMALLYDKNLVTPTGGNVSAKLRGSDHFWITPTGRFKGELKVDDLVRVTLEGKGFQAEVKPS
jgi:ribulose-5-phosphate 4-epimerase/fuculose-1-phosphate aldolase